MRVNLKKEKEWKIQNYWMMSKSKVHPKMITMKIKDINGKNNKEKRKDD
jgi:hypothetical protein